MLNDVGYRSIFIHEKSGIGHVWWYMPIIMALRRLR
jgi:hypothetical protein